AYRGNQLSESGIPDLSGRLLGRQPCTAPQLPIGPALVDFQDLEQVDDDRALTPPSLEAEHPERLLARKHAPDSGFLEGFFDGTRPGARATLDPSLRNDPPIPARGGDQEDLRTALVPSPWNRARLFEARLDACAGHGGTSRGKDNRAMFQTGDFSGRCAK